MTVPFIVLVVLFEAALLASLTRIRRLWRGQPNAWDHSPLRRRRSAPALIANAAILIPLVLLTGALGDTRNATVLSAVLVTATIGWLVASCVIWFTLWAFGRPARLVPPHLRDDRDS
jgi:uncharacterized membrane protein YbhN (UPF0104 family)